MMDWKRFKVRWAIVIAPRIMLALIILLLAGLAAYALSVWFELPGAMPLSGR